MPASECDLAGTGVHTPVRSSEGEEGEGGKGQKSALSQAEGLILGLAVGPAAVYASGFYFWLFRTCGNSALGSEPRALRVLWL